MHIRDVRERGNEENAIKLTRPVRQFIHLLLLRQFDLYYSQHRVVLLHQLHYLLDEPNVICKKNYEFSSEKTHIREHLFLACHLWESRLG